MDDEEVKRRRRTYGKGFRDGQAAAIEEMSNKALLSKISGLTPLQRKVWDCTPIQGAWTIGQICGQLTRAASTMEYAKVEHVLNVLKDSGLVRQDQNGWIRVVVKIREEGEKPVVIQEEQKAAEQKAPVDSKPKDPLTQLSELAATARKISEDLFTFAGAIEDVALEVDSALQKVGADTEKLRRLQTLMRELGALGS